LIFHDLCSAGLGVACRSQRSPLLAWCGRLLPPTPGQKRLLGGPAALQGSCRERDRINRISYRTHAPADFSSLPASSTAATCSPAACLPVTTRPTAIASSVAITV